MARNKTAKRTVKRNKTATHPALNMTHKIEMELHGIPAKLATQLDKEIATLKQKEAKLKQALLKLKSQLKNWESKIKSAGSAKHTASGKKQLNAAKKAHGQAVKERTNLTKTLEQTTQTLQAIVNKQAKFTALAKLLKQFDKDWVKKAKATKQTKKAKTKRATTAKPKSMPDTIIEQQPHFDSVESTTTYDDTVRFVETAEIVS